MRFLIAFLLLDSKGGIIFLMCIIGGLGVISLLITPPGHYSSIPFTSAIVCLLLAKRLRNY